MKSEAETFEFVVVRELRDADGEPIVIGSVLKHIEDGDRGVVVAIGRKGEHTAIPFFAHGDIAVQSSPGCQRISNQYAKWRHIDRDHQTYEERFLSWMRTPFDRDSLDAGDDVSEKIAVEGIMALLPIDIVDWEMGPWPDRLEDALGFLVEHLTAITEKRELG